MVVSIPPVKDLNGSLKVELSKIGRSEVSIVWYKHLVPCAFFVIVIDVTPSTPAIVEISLSRFENPIPKDVDGPDSSVASRNDCSKNIS